jgi:hypothetical protein
VQFDTHIVHRFQAEGFQVIYIPFLGSGDEDKDTKVLKNIVHEKEDELENGERYAIVGTFLSDFLRLSIHASLFEARTLAPQDIANSQLTIYPSISPTCLPPPGLTPHNSQQHKPIPTPMCPDNLLPPLLNRPIHLQGKRGLLASRLFRHRFDLRPSR